MLPVFADMRVLPGALASMAQGFDPRVENPGDPWLRPFNYPTLWLTLGELLGVENEAAFLAICLSMVVAFAVSGFSLLRKYPSWPLLVGLLSSATCLAMERGNNDLLAFFLIYLFALNIHRRRAVVPLVVAVLLKVYPIFAIGALPVLKAWKSFSVAVIFTLSGVLFFWDGLAAMRQATPWALAGSYGLPSTFLLIGQYQPEWFFFLACTAMLAIGAFFSMRDLNLHTASRSFQERQRIFLVGASIYVGSYLVAANWDYRLIFLLFCVPHSFDFPKRQRQFFLMLVLLAMNAQWLHKLKTELAHSGMLVFDLVEVSWIEVFRIPWFAADHAIKAVLFAFLGAAILRYWLESALKRPLA